MVKSSTENKAKKLSIPKQGLVVGVIALFVLLALFVNTLGGSERSVEAYCKIYKEENTRLESAPGDSYGALLFDHNSSDPGDFVRAFTRLEEVAPDDIRPDVRTLKQIYETIDEDASKALSAGLSGAAADENVEEWTEANCSESL